MLAETLTPLETQQPGQRPAPDAVLRTISDFCQELQPGDLVPTHQELMRRFEAPERAVRRALEELRRQGKIVRRRGARTFVADPELHRNGSSAPAFPAPVQRVEAETRSVVAIAVPDHALFDQAMGMLVGQARIEDVSIICHLLPQPEGRIPRLADLPQLPGNPLGFIVFRRDLLALAEDLQAEGHRVLFVGTPYADVVPQVPVVYGDQRYGGYLATKHLIEMGHRRIGFCAFEDAPKTQRWQGHQKAVREAARRGLDVQDCVIDIGVTLAHTYDSSMWEAVLRGPEAPTALVVWNDHAAARVIGELESLGLRVPDDVSIVGYDNLPEGLLVRPKLTTVHSPMEQQLQCALDLLTRDAAPTAPFQLVVSPTLICRDSTASR